MKVLWLCNFMLPVIAQSLNLPVTNKEGWLAGLADTVLERGTENGLELTLAFPVGEELLENRESLLRGSYTASQGAVLQYYGFYEDTVHPESYEEALEDRLRSVLEEAQPDMVHCFGAEYPHTLALCRVHPRRDRILIGMQGICTALADSYFAALPPQVLDTKTFRDWLKKDDLRRQQEKFQARGRMEQEAIALAGHIAGRTKLDHFYASLWHPEARYFVLKETLRSNFYQGQWREEDCVLHSIFVSQGDYPIKGLHYLLLALPEIRKEYPDAQVYVAGNSLVDYGTWKEKLKLSGYGKYLRQLIQEGGLEGHVTFLGPLDAEQMKAQYLKSHVFLCPSSMENSPNSLGEAMLLGMPCVSADVGGIPSLFTDRIDGILYWGYHNSKNEYDNICNLIKTGETGLKNVSESLKNAILKMWSEKEKISFYCKNARLTAEKNHNREENYQKMTEIYAEIVR